MIVFGSITFVRIAVPLASIALKLMKDTSQFWWAVREAFTTRQVFGGALAMLLCSIVVIIAGIGLLRRSRWAVALGGAAGFVALASLAVVSLLVIVQHQSSRYGGVENMPFTVWVMAAHGIAAWIALAGALRFRFALPTYLKETQDKGATERRPGLMEVIMRAAPPT
jgi:hypothetical protein